MLVNRSVDGVPSIAADYGTALRGLADHLYELGHRRLVYLSGVARSASNAARLAALAGFRADHPDVELSELESGVDFDSGAAAADAVLATGATGVLAFNDLVAMGLLSALVGSRRPRARTTSRSPASTTSRSRGTPLPR